jgi:hypothetical protein
VADGNRKAFADAAGVPADTLVDGTPFFDLVAKYLGQYKKEAVEPNELGYQHNVLSMPANTLVIDYGNHRAAAAQRMGKTIKGYFPVKKTTEARTFQPQMTPMQDLVAEYQMFSSFGQMGLSDYAKSSDSAEKVKEVIRTLAQSNKSLQNLDKQALEKNKNKILTHIHDMMNYAIAHFREHLKPEQFDAKKQQINKLLTKYNNLTSTNENIISEQPDSKNYLLQLERDKRAGMLILHILDKGTGKRTEVRGKMGYETDGYDPNDKLHQLLDKVGKSASVSDLMNGDVVSINPRHPDGASAKVAADKAYNENFADSKVKYTKPQFDVEWEEAERYPEFVKIGKAAWIELASKGKAVTIKSAKGINNTDAADPDSFKSLDRDKQARALTQLKSVNVEMPIVAVYPDGWKELIGGNTRLTAMLAQDGRATVWVFKVPDEVAELAENFADGKNPGRKGLAKRMGVNTKASVSSLRKTAKNSSGEKQRMAHWLANMKAGRQKAKKK